MNLLSFSSLAFSNFKYLIYRIAHKRILEKFNEKTKKWKKLFKQICKGLSDILHYFVLYPEEGILPKKKIDNWSIVYKDPKKPVEFLVYSVDK